VHDETMSTLFLVIWIVGLLVPIVLAPFIWNMAKATNRWWLHLIVGPVIIITEWCLGKLLFIVSGDDGTGPPGLGSCCSLWHYRSS
jgi:hypothetical protein